MKAAVLREFGKPLTVEEVPIPAPGPGEVLVRVKASGLCLTDVHIQEGIIKSVRLPYIPGHEMAGIVEALGEDVWGVEVGQHVVCGIDVTCGQCILCRGRRENLCKRRVRVGFERNGSHAEYAAVPAANLYPIAEHVPFEQACIIPDAVACIYHAIVDSGRVTAGDKVLVNGVGGLGLQGVQILKLLGAEVFASARTRSKLEMARELGADHTIAVLEQDLERTIEELTDGDMCDVALDLVGREDTMERMLRCVRPGGKVVALGYTVPEFAANYQELVIKEKELLGLRGSTRQNMCDTIRLVEEGKLVPVVTKRFAIEEINEALDFLRESKGLGRSVIVFE